MANDTQAMMQPDDWKINMSDAWQVLWWCRYLGVTKTQLEQAITVAGPVIVDLKQHFVTEHGAAPEAPAALPPIGASQITGRSSLSRSPF
jgi:hypothetical protein